MMGFRVGVGTQVLNTRLSPTAIVRAAYLAAVAGGVDSFWVADHLNSLVPRAIATQRYFGGARLVPKIDAQLEPWTMLGHLAAHNRIGRLRLGVGVTDAGRRNPAVTAQAAATLQLLTRGRAILGIGVGEREGNQPYGVEWTKPVARFEEAVATIRALWDSGGDLVSRESPYFPLRNAVFDLPPYRGKWPEIWIAAHGPRVLRLAGRYIRLVGAEFTVRPTFRCGVKWPGVAWAVAPSDRQRCGQPLYVAHSRFHRTGTLVGESRGRDLVSGSVRQVGQVSLVDRG